MMDFKTAILATGGIDSTVLMYQAVKEERKPVIITVDYGQVAFQKQKELLDYHIKKLKLPDLVVIEISYLAWQCQQGLFEPGYVPQNEDTLEDLRYSEFYIEGRNAIMLTYAMAYCSTHYIDELQVGYLYDEDEWQHRRSYKMITGDNSPHFVDIMNLLSLTGFSYQIRIRAPFYEQHMDKESVIKLGHSLSIDLKKKTYSCYFVPPCGKCDNCQLRQTWLGDNE